jgi:glycosyltransferase involved in cell wall biosynthesis
MNNLVLIDQTDPFESRIGGMRFFVMNFLNSVDPSQKVLLCGSTTKDNAHKRIRSNVEFLPMVLYQRKKDRYIMPQTFRFGLGLLRNKNKILSFGDVLHFQRFDYSLPFIFPKKQAKCVVYFHGAASKGYLSGRGLKSKAKGIIYSILERLILPKVDMIVTVSHKDEEFYSRKYPSIRGKIMTIPIPVDLDEFKIMSNKSELRRKYGLDEHRKIILYIGRLSKVKGIDLIMESFSELNREDPDTELIIVGKGEDENRLRKIASQLNTKNVRFLGSVPHENVPEIMNCADVMVMASFTEGFPTVVLEALACGLPVVSTDVGDISRIIINEKIGFLVNKRRKEELQTKIIRAIKISNEYKLIRRGLAEKYSPKNISTMILDVHNEMATNA